MKAMVAELYIPFEVLHFYDITDFFFSCFEYIQAIVYSTLMAFTLAQHYFEKQQSLYEA